MAQRSPFDQILTVAQAAQRLGVTRQRVQQLVQAGELHAHRPTPGVLLLLRDDVEELARKRARLAAIPLGPKGGQRPRPPVPMESAA